MFGTVEADVIPNIALVPLPRGFTDFLELAVNGAPREQVTDHSLVY